MSDSVWALVLYTGFGLAVVVMIFTAALWFVNSARRTNLRLKWRGSRPRDNRSHPNLKP